MNNKVLITFCLLVACLHLSAQTTIEGKVVDRKGNPIPGAKVEVSGTNESVLTELDGTFSMVTQKMPRKVNIYYVGMQSKKQKVTPDMLVKLSKTTWWNEKPDKYLFFVGIDGAFPEKNMKDPSFGIMVGYVKNFGVYAHCMFHKVQDDDGEWNLGQYPSPWTTGNSKLSFNAATAGLIFRWIGPIYCNIGIGYVSNKVSWQTAGGKYLKYTDDCYDGIGSEIGVFLRMKHLVVSGGYIGGDTPAICSYFGIGYCF
nr:carboxypeptidase-like regulatory domain-containing protein [Prevotella sp.]